MHDSGIERFFSFFDNRKSVFSLIIAGVATVVLTMEHFIELEINILFLLLYTFIWFAATIVERGVRHLNAAPPDTE